MDLDDVLMARYEIPEHLTSRAQPHPSTRDSDRLQPAQFFHGTLHSFREGDLVTSPAARGAGPEWNATDPRYSYATTDKLYAHSLAAHQEQARGRQGYVFEVQPTGHIEPDPVDNVPHAYRSAHPLRVVRQVPAAEIHEAQDARQRDLQEQSRDKWKAGKTPHPFHDTGEYGCGTCGRARAASWHTASAGPASQRKAGQS